MREANAAGGFITLISVWLEPTGDLLWRVRSKENNVLADETINTNICTAFVATF